LRVAWGAKRQFIILNENVLEEGREVILASFVSLEEGRGGGHRGGELSGVLSDPHYLVGADLT